MLALNVIYSFPPDIIDVLALSNPENVYVDEPSYVTFAYPTVPAAVNDEYRYDDVAISAYVLNPLSLPRSPTGGCIVNEASSVRANDHVLKSKEVPDGSLKKTLLPEKVAGREAPE